MNTIIEFCENPSPENFNKIPDYIQHLFFKLSNFCLENNEGDISLSMRVTKLYIKKMHGDGILPPNDPAFDINIRATNEGQYVKFTQNPDLLDLLYKKGNLSGQLVYIRSLPRVVCVKVSNIRPKY